MTGTRDRYGEPLEDLTPERPRTADEIRAHCDELRRILAEVRAQRQTKP